MLITNVQLLKLKHLQDMNKLYGMLSNRSTQDMPADASLIVLYEDYEIVTTLEKFLYRFSGHLLFFALITWRRYLPSSERCYILKCYWKIWRCTSSWLSRRIRSPPLHSPSFSHKLDQAELS